MARGRGLLAGAELYTMGPIEQQVKRGKGALRMTVRRSSLTARAVRLVEPPRGRGTSPIPDAHN